ncbi:hypothetical protein [Sphaerisporangium fuscum]|uniref:hypothetical protein n=1 Tax=Sphaerisporangium fuscum TaxID=2835868 RepID=UPI001BDD28C0|nr:hypothetical protein [Sphaerisporangium fuscum]
MGMTDSLAGYLRARARWRLDRVQSNDDGWNARCALALLDAAAYAETLGDDDPLISALNEAGCFGPYGIGEFEPGEAAARLIDFWHEGEPWELLAAIPGAPGEDRSSTPGEEGKCPSPDLEDPQGGTIVPPGSEARGDGRFRSRWRG